MSKIKDNELNELKNTVIELLYQVKSQIKLEKIKKELSTINDICNKYDSKWENLIDDISLMFAKNSKKYYTNIVNDIFDKIDKYSEEEKKRIENVLEKVIDIANDGLWEEIKKVINIGK